MFDLPSYVGSPHAPGGGLGAAHYATCLGHKKNARGQWEIVAQLETGRTLNKVRLLSLSAEGTRSAIRLPLPPINGVGVVLLISHASSGTDAVWLGGVDSETVGVDMLEARDRVEIHPSGNATAVDALGQRTKRTYNGDTEFVGNEDAEPYAFRWRDGSGEYKPLPAFKRLTRRVFDYGFTSLWSLAVARVAGLSFDARTRLVRLFLGKDRLEISDGRVRMVANSVTATKDGSYGVAVALAPVALDNDANLAEELAKVKSKLNAVLNDQNAIKSALNSTNALLASHVHPGIGVPAPSLSGISTNYTAQTIVPNDQSGEAVGDTNAVAVANPGSQTLRSD